MDKINPTLYITDWAPTDEAVMDASEWFETETMSFKATEEDDVAKAEKKSSLIWYAAQGWKVKKEVEVTKVAYGKEETNPTTGSKYIVIVPEYGYKLYEEGVVTHDSTTGQGVPATPGSTYIRVDLERRVLKSEKTLNALIASYTKAYNEGRSLNDQRYDDIIALYKVTLDKTEDELIAINTDNSTYKSLIEPIIAKIETDCNTFTTQSTGLYNSFGSGQLARINQAFTNKLSAARQDLIDRGMYSTTLWSTVSAGIEREKALAISDFEDKKLTQKITLEQAQLSARNSMRDRMLAAYERLRVKLESSTDKNLTVRNSIMTALMNFMERRNDDYPNMDSIARLVSNIGVANSSSTATG